MRPSVPDVIRQFKAYHDKHPVWGSLHIVLEDGNVADRDVRACMVHAMNKGDHEGYELAEILMQMSKTQRLKLRSLA